MITTKIDSVQYILDIFFTNADSEKEIRRNEKFC
jgi:hypothetical protein